ncbi:uncharacterized protein PG998_010270 [Apiospora kogelbergensis]|uniref:Uncharacterized protein n=1 Tax=Apiospora kogelbergensis TaxID=1337665 RepID=A0AAW0RAC5_9PEZI
MVSQIAGLSGLVLLALGSAICAMSSTTSSNSSLSNGTYGITYHVVRHQIFPTYVVVKRDNGSDAGDDVPDAGDDSSDPEAGDP